MNKLLTWMKNHKILSGLLIFALIGLISSIANTDVPKVSEDVSGQVNTMEKAETTTEKVENATEPTISIKAKAIIDEFENNGVGAKAKYKDKLVEVSGIIGSINEDFIGNPYVMIHDISDQYQIKGVQCFVKRNNIDSLLSLSKGDSITVQGNVSDDFILNVLMRNCEVK